MEDLGPAWFLEEFPYPIALPWQIATHHGPLDGLALAGVIEMALKVVTGLQLSAYVATRQTRPVLLGADHFATLPLGNLKRLALHLRDELATHPIEGLPMLGAWPSSRVESQLDALIGKRNELSHPEILSPSLKAELTQGIGRDALGILESLAWLRGVELCVFTEGSVFAGERGLGRVQVFRGTESQPKTRRVSWEGQVTFGRTYARARLSRHDHILLDVEPFLIRDRVGKSRLEELCLWSGITRTGDIKVSQLTSRSETTRPIEPERPRLSKIKIFETSDSSTSLTRHEGEVPVQALPENAPVPRGAPPRASRPKRRYWPWVVALVGLAAIGLAVASLQGQSTNTAELGPQARVAARDEPGPGEAPPTCVLPDLAHRWSFDTIVLGNKPGMEYGLNVRGHYGVALRSVGCSLVAELEKSGWTQSGERRDFRQRGQARLDVSGTARSAAGSFALESKHDDPNPSRVAFRWSRFGPHLIGLWRHEGADYERGGYWGTIFGLREGWKGIPPNSACFEECGRRCFAGRDPLDERTEECLQECGRALVNCGK